MGSMSHIRDILDDARYRFYDIADRMKYLATGEDPGYELEDLNFYSQDLELEMAKALAQEIDQRIRKGMAINDLVTGAEDLGLIKSVEFRLVLPKPPVPVHREFITEITPEDLRRWKLDGTT